MAIAASGAVSFSDLRTEFVGGSSAISFSDLYRGGSNIKAKAGDNQATNLAASVPASGTIDLADFHGTAKGFKFIYSSTHGNQNVSSLFGDDYDLNYPKIVDINSGVSIYGSGDEAITIPSGLAGTLVINNAGNILGFGGAASGGAGGSAINCASSGVTINNTGLLAGGGGGGGNGGGGGGGGGGSYTTTSYSYNYIYSLGQGTFWYNGQYTREIAQSGNVIANNFANNATVVSYSGNTWYRGSLQQGSSSDGYYQYGTRNTHVSTTNTNGGSGGSGGAGGRGQGYNQSLASGSSGSGGSGGGTNAGSGGTGGTGGAGSAYATAGGTGSTGSTGANGNRTNGSGGSGGGSGGAAGAAVTGTSVTMNNTGTLHGAVA